VVSLTPIVATSHYPHKYPIAAGPYILVVLVDKKKLEQQHRDLSEPTNAHACFLFTIPSSLHATRTFAWQDILGHCLDFSDRKDIYSNGGICVDPLPISSRTYRRPHTSLITPTTSSAREYIRNDVKMRVTRSSTAFQNTRCGGTCNIDEDLVIRAVGQTLTFEEG